MSITLLSKILNLASVFSFIDDDFRLVWFSFIDDDFRLVWFILGFVAGADLGMIFAALMYAAGKDKNE